MAEPTNGGRVPAFSLRAEAGGVRPGQEGIEPTPNPREWLEAVRRHRRLAVGVAGVVVAIAAYLGYTEPLLYRATSVVRLVDARRALAGGLIGSAGADVALLSANPVMSQVEVLRSRATAGAVVDDMPILRIRTRGFPVALVRDVYLAPKVQWDSLEPRSAPSRSLSAVRTAARANPTALSGRDKRPAPAPRGILVSGSGGSACRPPPRRPSRGCGALRPATSPGSRTPTRRPGPRCRSARPPARAARRPGEPRTWHGTEAARCILNMRR